MVTKKLRTKCLFDPVAFMIAAMVLPLGCRSRARTVACLVLGCRKAGLTFLRFDVLFSCNVCENIAVRHDAILSVATAHAPPPPKPHRRHRQRGGIRGPKKPASALVLRMLCLQRKSSPICKENARPRAHLEDAHGLIVIRREVHGVARYEAKSRSVAGCARYSSLSRELQSRLPAASPLCPRLISSIERAWSRRISERILAPRQRIGPPS